jgi:hypothetical protein
MQEYSPYFKMSRPNLFRVLGVQPRLLLGVAVWTFPPNVQSADDFGVQKQKQHFPNWHGAFEKRSYTLIGDEPKVINPLDGKPMAF